MTRQTPPQAITTTAIVQMLFVAFELSSAKWKLAFGDRSERKPRVRTIDAWDFEALAEEVAKTKQRFGLDDDAPVLTCHEAGRDGFSVHRALVARLGVESLVIDPASIEVERRKRRRKTDRLDVLKLQAKLRSWAAGDKGVWTVVRVPSVEQEDARRETRGRERLVDERRQHSARIKSLLVTVGLKAEVNGRLVEWLRTARTPYGTAVPANLRKEIEWELERFELAGAQLRELEKELEAAIAKPKTQADEKSAMLHALKGIGLVGSTVFVREFFGWRQFKNRREVGGAAGLTGTPYDSGASDREQGIDKAGNRRVRTLAVELAWCWRRHQPNSKLSRWFRERFDDGTKRSKRKGIVALARRLLVDLWKYLTYGVVPEGAEFRKSTP